MSELSDLTMRTLSAGTVIGVWWRLPPALRRLRALERTNPDVTCRYAYADGVWFYHINTSQSLAHWVRHVTGLADEEVPSVLLRDALTACHIACTAALTACLVTEQPHVADLLVTAIDTAERVLKHTESSAC